MRKIKPREIHETLEMRMLEALEKGNMSWGDLLKIVLASCEKFATFGRFNSRLQYLLRKRYIKRLRWGIYGITENGKMYLELLIKSCDKK